MNKVKSYVFSTCNYYVSINLNLTQVGCLKIVLPNIPFGIYLDKKNR
jgi:hypothetical protein